MTLDGGDGDDFFQFGQLFGAPRVSGCDALERRQDGDGADEPLLDRRHGRPRRRALDAADHARLPHAAASASRPSSTAATATTSSPSTPTRRCSSSSARPATTSSSSAPSCSRSTTRSPATRPIVNGGDGDDRVEYNINAPVSIDGGEGVDTVVVVGTEAADNFVITSDAVMGAGLTIEYDSVERVDVDGMEGDDHFFVLSTNPNVVTTIIGGAGQRHRRRRRRRHRGRSSRCRVEGISGDDQPQRHQRRPDLRRHLRAGHPPQRGRRAATGAVVITQSGGNTTVVEDGGSRRRVVLGLRQADDCYTISFAVHGSDDRRRVAYITVSAALSPSKDLRAGGGSV